jgi:hypothetical protein
MSNVDRVAYLKWLENKNKFGPFLIEAMAASLEQSKVEQPRVQAEHKTVKETLKVALERTDKVAAEYSKVHTDNNEKKAKIDWKRNRMTQ